MICTEHILYIIYLYSRVWESSFLFYYLGDFFSFMLECYLDISMDFPFIWENFLSHPLTRHTYLYYRESNFSIILFTLTKTLQHFKKTTILWPPGRAGHRAFWWFTYKLQTHRPFLKKITKDLIRFFFPWPDLQRWSPNCHKIKKTSVDD